MSDYNSLNIIIIFRIIIIINKLIELSIYTFYNLICAYLFI